MSQKPKNVTPSKSDTRQEPREGVIEREKRQTAVVAKSFQGPLPPPALLQEYDAVVPGLAKEIVQWTTSQTAHRQGIEDRAMSIDEKMSTWYVVEVLLGQLFALIIALTVIGAVVYLATQGREVAAGVLGTVGFGGIVAAFITGRRKRTPSESNEKPEPPPPASKKK
ncbi:DUF2335 domain-containing protein [Pseudomonas sp. SDI]|uniref:DUF2335 domain-containing protein n=1 Tax=Pseudomonas sp. SDI TaxID=2170734 RepID=UPI000DE6E2A5|nr:DUF2335 domain-containing protein [Pseudomonas sp. SDI]PWB34680.1 DUF2335 domain-containing protein [Pseudomonas sp. SDI]